jgi:hypothetical protein
MESKNQQVIDTACISLVMLGKHKADVFISLFESNKPLVNRIFDLALETEETFNSIPSIVIWSAFRCPEFTSLIIEDNADRFLAGFQSDQKAVQLATCRYNSS